MTFRPAALCCLALIGILALASCIADSDLETGSASRSQLGTMLAETASTPTTAHSPTPQVASQSPATATPSRPLTTTPVATAQDSTAASIAAVDKPDRDLIQLATRYGLADQLPTVVATRVPAKVGDEETFWVSNSTNNTYFQVQAGSLSNPSAYLYGQPTRLRVAMIA